MEKNNKIQIANVKIEALAQCIVLNAHLCVRIANANAMLQHMKFMSANKVKNENGVDVIEYDDIYGNQKKIIYEDVATLLQDLYDALENA